KTSPYRFYQHFINVDDAQVGQFLRFFTFLSREEIEALETQVKEAPQRREAQKVLAREVTALVHGPEEAVRAERASQALFGTNITELEEAELLDVLADAPSSTQPRSSLAPGALLIDLLIESRLATSRKTAREFIGGGGVYINNIKQTDVDRAVGEGDLLHDRYVVLRRGKKNHHLVSFG
ncbi:MAG: S4 domain-containing protein, partial [Actinomycetota bacterium]